MTVKKRTLTPEQRKKAFERARKNTEAQHETIALFFKETKSMNKRFYGYGVVDKDNNPWFDDGLVSKNKEELLKEVEALNADYEILGVDDDGEIQHVGFEPPAPYRVVRLEWVDDSDTVQGKEPTT